MRFLGFFALFIGLAARLSAEPITSSGMNYDSDGIFRAGQWEASAGVGVFFSPFLATKGRPANDYVLAVFDVGYMLSNIKEWGPARGNFEILGEVFGGPVVTGDHGNYVAGLTFWGRYNFVQPGWKFVPYGQLGIGATATDLDQSIIGQVFQFNLEAAVGTRYFIKPHVALNAEYRYQHLSNANSGTRNVGVNAQGVYLGVSWFF